MEPTPTPPEIPEAIKIDYAPPPPHATGWWWRILVIIFCTICLAIGSGCMTAALLSQSSREGPVFAGLGIGFLTASVGLPVMIFVAKRL